MPTDDPHNGQDLPTVQLDDASFIQCPHAQIDRIFAAGGVAVDPSISAVVVLGSENLTKLALNTKSFSSKRRGALVHRMGSSSEPIPPAVSELLQRAHPEVPALFTADPPEHTVHRRLVNLAFSPANMRKLEPDIRRRALVLIAAFQSGQPVDFGAAFAVPFPLGVIGAILGLDDDVMLTVKQWSVHMVAGNSQPLTAEERLRVAQTILDFQERFLAEIESRRAESAGDVLSDLIHAELPNGDRLSDAELLPMIAQFVTAGHETTTYFLSSAAVRLAEDHQLHRELQADNSKIPAFLEEVLRYTPPVMSSLRWGAEDTTIAGAEVATDQLIVPLWGSVGRDPKVFEDPDAFDINRPNGRRHMAFGHGPHFCAGAALARLEAKVAFESLLARYDRFTLDTIASDLHYADTFAQHGYRRVVLLLEGSA